MKFRIIYALIIFFTLIFFCITAFKKTYFNRYINAKEVFEANDENMKEVKDETAKYEIDIYIPDSKNQYLNQILNEFIEKKVLDFKNEIANLPENKLNIKNKLKIVFDKYEYENYISYVFKATTDYGGLHPNHTIDTISYDTKENVIVTIDDLILKKENLLTNLSSYTYNQLKQDEKIKKVNNDEWLKKGTGESKENFSRFAFSKDGLIIFFQTYWIAPYFAGEFVVTVPYNKLN